MGSIVDKIWDDEQDRLIERKRSKLLQIGEDIARTNPEREAADDILWIKENYEKIIRNKRLIELIG